MEQTEHKSDFTHISDLYALDNLDVCKNSFYRGFHVWHAVRFKVLIEVFRKTNDLQNPVLKQEKDLKKIWKFILYSVGIRPPKKQADIIFWSSNVVNMNNEGVFVNRLYDYFYGQLPARSLLFEDAYFFEFRRPRAIPVSYTGWFTLKTKIISFLQLQNRQVNQDIIDIIQNIKNIFPVKLSDGFWDDVTKYACCGYQYFVIKRKMYRKYFSKVCPRILFKEDASYGGDQALALVCKELGIVYAEFQHGFIGREHPAYNYGQAFFSDTMEYLLPSVFMIFGKYWGDQISHPACKVSVGFPFLELQVQKNNSMPEKKILLVSDGDNPMQNRLIIEWLSDFISRYKYQIILKLHPIECSRKEEWYGDLLSNNSIEIKIYEPVYPLINASDIIIGGGSTVMFETLCFGKSPFVFRNKRVMADRNFCQIFSTFDSKKELQELIECRDQMKPINYSHFFDKGWESNYMEYISNLITK